MLGILTALGKPHYYLMFWLLPLLTWQQVITRMRNIAEHAMVPDNNDVMRNARTTYARWWERALWAPYWVNYHVDHHMLIYVPCYNLPKLHALLLAKGYGPRMEIQKNYSRRAEARDIEARARRGMTDPKTFIRNNTELIAPPLVPEVRLHLATEVVPLWRKTEEELHEAGVPPPYWAFAWAGGQALSRYVLDHPEEVRGKSVLDFGSGSGLVAIAATRPVRATCWRRISIHSPQRRLR